jgi:hypothetical protein
MSGAVWKTVSSTHNAKTRSTAHDISCHFILVPCRHIGVLLPTSPDDQGHWNIPLNAVDPHLM